MSYNDGAMVRYQRGPPSDSSDQWSEPSSLTIRASQSSKVPSYLSHHGARSRNHDHRRRSNTYAFPHATSARHHVLHSSRLPGGTVIWSQETVSTTLQHHSREFPGMPPGMEDPERVSEMVPDLQGFQYMSIHGDSTGISASMYNASDGDSRTGAGDMYERAYPRGANEGPRVPAFESPSHYHRYSTPQADSNLGNFCNDEADDPRPGRNAARCNDWMSEVYRDKSSGPTSKHHRSTQGDAFGSDAGRMDASSIVTVSQGGASTTKSTTYRIVNGKAKRQKEHGPARRHEEGAATMSDGVSVVSRGRQRRR